MAFNILPSSLIFASHWQAFGKIGKNVTVQNANRCHGTDKRELVLDASLVLGSHLMEQDL